MNRLILAVAAFSITTATAAIAETKSTDQVDKNAPDYVRCVKLQATGSLVSRQKECHTNAEWKRMAEAGNRAVRDASNQANSGGYTPQ